MSAVWLSVFQIHVLEVENNASIYKCKIFLVRINIMIGLILMLSLSFPF